MHRLALVVVLLIVPATASAERVINGEKAAKIDCSKEPEVAIHSGEGDFTFTGTCDKISLKGGNNKLTIENVKKLEIVGGGNTVGIKGADRITITGANNTVTYDGTVSGKGKPSVAAIGKNTVKKN